MCLQWSAAINWGYATTQQPTEFHGGGEDPAVWLGIIVVVVVVEVVVVVVVEVGPPGGACALLLTSFVRAAAAAAAGEGERERARACWFPCCRMGTIAARRHCH